MTEPTNVVRFCQSDDVDDPLTEVLRAGARRLLAQAVELEAEVFLAARDDLRLPDGRPRDCQEFRVRAGIMGKKETPYVPTQRSCDTERVTGSVAGRR